MNNHTRRALVADQPLGRLGVPADVAEVVAFLVSERGRWISGQLLHVDGGFSARFRRPPVGGSCQAPPMACETDDARDLAGQLEDVSMREYDRYTRLEVSGRAFGYLWEPTSTVGLKQTLAEQAALVAERPHVFEVQFTTSGFGWVVVHLDGVERDELAELVFEAWLLSAPARLVEQRGEKLPV